MRTIGCIIIAMMAAQAFAAEEITEKRAWELAAVYYARYFDVEGGVGQPKLHGGYWDAPIHEGAVGSFAGYVRVSRATGEVSGRGHPAASAQSLDAWERSLRKHSPHPRKP